MNQEQQNLTAKKPIIQTIDQINKEKIATYAYLIFSLLTISFFGIFAILPAFSTITNLRKQYEDNQKISQALEQKLNALVALDQEYTVLEGDLPYVYNAVPSSAEIPTFIRQVETLGQESNVFINSLTTGTVEYYPLTESQDGLFSYSFSLEASGEEININRFINSIISFNRIVSIDRINTGRSTGDEFRTSIGGKVFFSEDQN